MAGSNSCQAQPTGLATKLSGQLNTTVSANPDKTQQLLTNCIAMYKYLLITTVISAALGLNSCRADSGKPGSTTLAPADDIQVEQAIAETYEQASPDEVAALLKSAAGLQEVLTDACTLMEATELEALLQLTPGDVQAYQLFHQPNKSTCVWSWNNGNEAISLRVEFNEYGQQVSNRYSSYFGKLIEEGEWAEPIDSPAGVYKYQAVEGPGDQCIWSPVLRSLKCRLGESFVLFIYINHLGEERPSAEKDLRLLRQLLGKATKRLSVS